MARLGRAWASLVSRHGSAWACVLVVVVVAVPAGTVAAGFLVWTLEQRVQVEERGNGQS